MFFFLLDVCFLRLDFECFTTVASGLTTEVNGGACTDMFTVTVRDDDVKFPQESIPKKNRLSSQSPTGFAVPTICGQNTGQHSERKIIYIS